MRRLSLPPDMEEPVKRFFQRMELSSETSMLEVGDRKVYFLVRPSVPTASSAEPWTEQKNQRRHQLIDKQLRGDITLEESLELACLQTDFDHWIDAVAPLPIDYARKLHDQLVEQALARQASEKSK